MDNGRLVILAGGASSRMKKPANEIDKVDGRLIREADSKPKSMIGIGDEQRPFLDYLLFNARQTGYEHILIVTGENNGIIKSYYGTKDRKNEFHGLKISYAVQHIPEGREKPLGTADALYQGLQFMKEWEGKKITVCNSDNLYSQKALQILLSSNYKNAMIDYDRNALEFDQERIEKFAVTIKDDEHFLLDIIEKPDASQVEEAKAEDGMIGVSMNIFSFSYDMIMPFLETVPLHPLRLEKELPTAIKMMISTYPKSLYAYPLSEHVPDLTDKTDIMSVKKYLSLHFPKPLF